MLTYDDELRAHNAQLRAATGIRPGEHVLDIGCGAGQSTREAALAAAPGQVLGVDVSAPALEHARDLSAAQDIDNVSYEHGDAQVHSFRPGRFDVAISRFGLMFFADPVAAFANIASALRPDARLVALVWQRREDNEWAVALDGALGRPTQPRNGLDAFSLGEPRVTERLLDRSGFRDIHFAAVHEPVFYGHDVSAALAWVRGFRDVADVLSRVDSDAREHAIARLRVTLSAHWSAEAGVVLDSRAWLVTGRARP